MWNQHPAFYVTALFFPAIALWLTVVLRPAYCRMPVTGSLVLLETRRQGKWLARLRHVRNWTQSVAVLRRT